MSVCVCVCVSVYIYISLSLSQALTLSLSLSLSPPLSPALWKSPFFWFLVSLSHEVGFCLPVGLLGKASMSHIQHANEQTCQLCARTRTWLGHFVEQTMCTTTALGCQACAQCRILCLNCCLRVTILVGRMGANQGSP